MLADTRNFYERRARVTTTAFSVARENECMTAGLFAICLRCCRLPKTRSFRRHDAGRGMSGIDTKLPTIFSINTPIEDENFRFTRR